MRQPKSFLSAKLLTPSIALLVALTVLSTPVATAQTGEALGPTVIDVEVSIDPSRTGRERCVVEPEELQIPAGISTVMWSIVVEGPGTDSGNAATRLDNVEFSSALPVTASERLDAQRWHVTFDREEVFPETPYDVVVREANGTVTECYPHVAGSTDQGGG